MANNNELARRIRHEGIRVGEIIAYRAWRVIVPGWLSRGDLLHSVAMRDYVWYPDGPASGDVRTHGIYSFRKLLCEAHASISVPSTEKCSSDNSGLTCGWLRSLVMNLVNTSPFCSRSRF